MTGDPLGSTPHFDKRLSEAALEQFLPKGPEAPAAEKPGFLQIGTKQLHVSHSPGKPSYLKCERVFLGTKKGASLDEVLKVAKQLTPASPAVEKLANYAAAHSQEAGKKFALAMAPQAARALDPEGAKTKLTAQLQQNSAYKALIAASQTQLVSALFSQNDTALKPELAALKEQLIDDFKMAYAESPTIELQWVLGLVLPTEEARRFFTIGVHITKLQRLGEGLPETARKIGQELNLLRSKVPPGTEIELRPKEVAVFIQVLEKAASAPEAALDVGSFLLYTALHNIQKHANPEQKATLEKASRMASDPATKKTLEQLATLAKLERGPIADIQKLIFLGRKKEAETLIGACIKAAPTQKPPFSQKELYQLLHLLQSEAGKDHFQSLATLFNAAEKSFHTLTAEDLSEVALLVAQSGNKALMKVQEKLLNQLNPADSIIALIHKLRNETDPEDIEKLTQFIVERISLFASNLEITAVQLEKMLDTLKDAPQVVDDALSKALLSSTRITQKDLAPVVEKWKTAPFSKEQIGEMLAKLDTALHTKSLHPIGLKLALYLQKNSARLKETMTLEQYAALPHLMTGRGLTEQEHKALYLSLVTILNNIRAQKFDPIFAIGELATRMSRADSPYYLNEIEKIIQKHSFITIDSEKAAEILTQALVNAVTSEESGNGSLPILRFLASLKSIQKFIPKDLVKKALKATEGAVWQNMMQVRKELMTLLPFLDTVELLGDTITAKNSGTIGPEIMRLILQNREGLVLDRPTIQLFLRVLTLLLQHRDGEAAALQLIQFFGARPEMRAHIEPEEVEALLATGFHSEAIQRGIEEFHPAEALRLKAATFDQSNYEKSVSEVTQLLKSLSTLTTLDEVTTEILFKALYLFLLKDPVGETAQAISQFLRARKFEEGALTEELLLPVLEVARGRATRIQNVAVPQAFVATLQDLHKLQSTMES